MHIENNSYLTKYFDIDKQRFVDFDKHKLCKIKLTDFELDSHIYNSRFMSQRPDNYKCVLKNIVPIPPRSSWSFLNKTFTETKKNIVRSKKKYSLEDLITFCNRAKKLTKNKIAIELSGGLDTGIIIGIAKELNLQPLLIGGISDKYEFRTERYIQNLIAEQFDEVKFIPESNALPFSSLKSTPFHVVPNKSSLHYYLNSLTSDWAKLNNIKYIFNGIGFDSVLVDPVLDETFLNNKANLFDNWPNDYVFMPNATCYVNIAEIYTIRKILLSMRYLQPLDTKKLWARKYFKNYIPIELSQYQYKASFAANYAEGLKVNKDEIFEICINVNKFCNNIKRLSPDKIIKLIDSVEEFNHKDEFELLSCLSFINWINSFIK